MAATPEYEIILKTIKRKAKKESKENRAFFRKLKKKKPEGLTKSMRQLNDKAFEHHECLNCANCCRTALAVFEKPDVRRIARHFDMAEPEFIRKYLKPHPDYEYLIKTLPCPFLSADNKCSIYDIRPAGCRTYPPAKLRLTEEQLDVIHDNIGICPAVSEIVDHLKARFESNGMESR